MKLSAEIFSVLSLLSAFAQAEPDGEPIQNAPVDAAKAKVIPADYYSESAEQFEAIAELQKLAGNGDCEAAAFLADIYSKKFLGFKYDKFRDANFAKKYAYRAAELGDEEYAEEVAQLLKNTPEELDKFVRSISARADKKKIAEICLKYFGGTDKFCGQPRFAPCEFAPTPEFGAKTSARDATEYFKAAEKLAEAFPGSDFCAPLADCFAKGIGTDKSPEKAFEIMRKISFSSLPYERVFALLFLARAYETGFGVKPDAEIARICFDDAFPSPPDGDAAATAISARRFYTGYAAPKDAAFAKRILAEACLKRNFAFSDFKTELYPCAVALFLGKFNAADADKKIVDSLKNRAASLELEDAKLVLKTLSLPLERAPSKEEFETALGSRINSDRLAAIAMLAANSYYLLAGKDQNRIEKLSAAIYAANAAADPDFLSETSCCFKNFQDRPALILIFGADDLKKFSAKLDDETKPSPKASQLP